MEYLRRLQLSIDSWPMGPEQRTISLHFCIAIKVV
jgi:hypothetical protein